MDGEALIQAVTGLDSGLARRDKIDSPAVCLPPQRLRPVMQRLRDDPRFGFDLLLDHTAIDWLEQGQIELLYRLYSTVHGHGLVISVRVPRAEPIIASVGDLWPIAHWQEREVFDLFGVLYDGHPDLRRLFLEDDWRGNPLRKDYVDEYMLRRPG